MKSNRTPSKEEQKRVEACEHVINWASEDRKHRGCIIIATDEKSSTCAVIGQNQNLITSLVSSLRETSGFRNILTTALMIDVASDSLESNTDEN